MTRPQQDPALARPALQKRSRQKRDRLIAAGIEIFARDGYDAARIVDIAEAAGISVGLFYQRFKDKQTFFHALEAEFVRRGCENWDRFFEQADPAWSGQRLVNTLVGGLARVLRRNIGFFRGLVTLGQQDASVVAPGVELDRYGAEKLQAHLIRHGLVRIDDLPRDAVYIGLASITRSLVMSELLATGRRRISRTRLEQEHARMLSSYLGLSDDAPRG